MMDPDRFNGLQMFSLANSMEMFLAKTKYFIKDNADIQVIRVVSAFIHPSDQHW